MKNSDKSPVPSSGTGKLFIKLPQVRDLVEAIKRKGLKESINSAPVRTIEKYRSKSETRVLNKILTAKHRDKI